MTTGSEVYKGRIKDAFGPVLRRKFDSLECPVEGQTITSDDPEMTASAIKAWVEKGCGLVCVTGGMSVDPDDQTPTAIRMAGARRVFLIEKPFAAAIGTGLPVYDGLIGAHCEYYERKPGKSIVRPKPIGTKTTH